MVVFNNWLKHTTLVKNVAINHPSDKECAGNPFEYFFFSVPEGSDGHDWIMNRTG